MDVGNPSTAPLADNSVTCLHLNTLHSNTLRSMLVSTMSSGTTSTSRKTNQMLFLKDAAVLSIWLGGFETLSNSNSLRVITASTLFGWVNICWCFRLENHLRSSVDIYFTQPPLGHITKKGNCLQVEGWFLSSVKATSTM